MPEFFWSQEKEAENKEKLAKSGKLEQGIGYARYIQLQTLICIYDCDINTYNLTRQYVIEARVRQVFANIIYLLEDMSNFLQTGLVSSTLNHLVR